MKTQFDNAVFIKPDVQFIREFSFENYSPMFRKNFVLNDFGNAKLYVCGLGYGYYYVNGKKVSEDLFTAPVSNYNKTLWYNVYDVTHNNLPCYTVFEVNEDSIDVITKQTNGMVVDRYSIIDKN